eukprot:951718-Pleurochrysis_carterae.AAC.2
MRRAGVLNAKRRPPRPRRLGYSRQVFDHGIKSAKHVVGTETCTQFQVTGKVLLANATPGSYRVRRRTDGSEDRDSVACGGARTLGTRRAPPRASS